MLMKNDHIILNKDTHSINGNSDTKLCDHYNITVVQASNKEKN